MQSPITPFLWFDTEAEDAANFHISMFPNSRILAVSRYGEAGARTARMVVTMAFELNGQRFTAPNAGPVPKFSHAVSFVINCENQDQVDRYWELLSDGGQEVACGWLTDRFGLSWQVVPEGLTGRAHHRRRPRARAAGHGGDAEHDKARRRRRAPGCRRRRGDAVAAASEQQPSHAAPSSQLLRAVITATASSSR